MEIYKFNGYNLDNVSAWYIVEKADWLNWNKSSDTITNAGGLQWVFSSPTYSRGRTVAITGHISCDTEALLLQKIFELKKIFAIDWSPVWEWAKEFYVQDVDWNEWTAQARVKTMIDFKRDGTSADYRVSLFCSDARYKSAELNIITWNEGIAFGMTLPFVLWFDTTETSEPQEITSDWNVNAPLKITITATGNIDTVVIIKNITTGEVFSFNCNGVEADVFVIDSGLEWWSPSLTKNWTSILSQKVAGSSWLSVIWTMEFVASDTDDKTDFTIKYEYYNRLL